MKGNITLNVDTDFEVPARLIAQILAKADSFTQADFFVWFFNELYYRQGSGGEKYRNSLRYLVADLDHQTKIRFQELIKVINGDSEA